MVSMNKYKSVIILAILLGFVMLFMFYWMGLSPLLEKSSEQNLMLVQRKEEQQLLQNKVDEIRAEMEGEETSDEKGDALPQSDMADELILDIRKITARSAAVLKSIDFNLTQSNEIHLMTNEQEGSYPQIYEIKMNAQLEGTYMQIQNWLKELEELPRLMKVDSFNMKRRSDSASVNDNSMMTATIVFTAYYESASSESNNDE